MSLLQTQGLGVSFGGVHAVKAVDFTLKSGELRCLISPMAPAKAPSSRCSAANSNPRAAYATSRASAFQGWRRTMSPGSASASKPRPPASSTAWMCWKTCAWPPVADKRQTKPAPLPSRPWNASAWSTGAHAWWGDRADGQRQWVELGNDPRLAPGVGITGRTRRRHDVPGSAQDRRADQRNQRPQHRGWWSSTTCSSSALIAGTVTVFNQGAILAQGSFAEVTQDPAVRERTGQAGDQDVLKSSGSSAGYGRIPVLRAHPSSRAANTCVGVLGRNGMGKTTLLRALMGEIPAMAGSLAFCRRRLKQSRRPPTRPRRHRRCAPGPADIPDLSVRENLRMGCA